MATRTVKRTVGLFVLGSVLVFLMSGILYWQAIGADISNPRANMWRTVREGFQGFTKVTTAGHKILIVNSGENWREFRNGFLMPVLPVDYRNRAGGHGPVLLAHGPGQD